MLRSAQHDSGGRKPIKPARPRSSAARAWLEGALRNHSCLPPCHPERKRRI